MQDQTDSEEVKDKLSLVKAIAMEVHEADNIKAINSVDSIVNLLE